MRKGSPSVRKLIVQDIAVSQQRTVKFYLRCVDVLRF